MESWQSTRHIKRLPIAIGQTGTITSIDVVDLVHKGPGPASAESGQFVIADKAMVVAHAGACVIAESDTGVEALTGSQVLARAGSHVLAHHGCLVFARAGAMILAEAGSRIIAEAGARIYGPQGDVRVQWVKSVIGANSEFEISKRWIRLRLPGANNGTWQAAVA